MRKSKGFTLVELLVVIGIIALLLSILIPVLGGIRRQAGQTKCLSSLRQIGVAFQLYAQEQEGFYPVSVYKAATAPSDPNIPQEVRWPDMLSKYVHKVAATSYDDVSQYRASSVLWGCPQYDVAANYDAASLGDRVRTGYGMQYYPLSPTAAAGGTAAAPGNLAYMDYAANSVGRWYRRDVWTRKGSSLRGIIADSNTHIIGTSATYAQSTGWFQKGRDTVPPSGTAAFVYMDGSRHVKPNATDREMRRATGINMLFADGSVRSVTPAEAWKATRGGGVTNFSN